MYADFRIPGIEGISGLLVLVVGMCAGFAMAAHQDANSYNTFVIEGEWECYEG